MTQPASYRPPDVLSATLGVLLVALGCIAAVAGTVAGVQGLVAARELALDLRPWTQAQATAWIAGGWSAGILMWGLAWVLRRQRMIEDLLNQIWLRPISDAGPPNEPWASTSARPASASDRHILEALRQVQADVLLSDEQRQIRRREFQSRQGRQLAAVARAALDSGQMTAAAEAVARLAEIVPDDADLPALRRELEKLRGEAARQDIEQGVRRVRDLMATGKFESALEQARELAGRYPDWPDGAGLAAEVSREGERFTTEQRRRLYKEVNRLTEKRQWREALAAGREFLAKFPHSTEAGLIGAQLPTLIENARIAEVRELRRTFLDLMGRKRHAEALAVAEEVVKRFPNTAVAIELRAQLDRLRELAGK